MPARFILGRAGTGKTWHCLARIRSLVEADPFGPPIYWVLPRQATFQAERELTCRLTAFTRVRVVSFELLGEEILSACGDVGMPAITAAGRRLVVGHLLRQHQDDLRFYIASARHPGLAGELDGIFGELDQAGLDSASLETALASAAAPLSESLADKLHDLQLLMRGYETFLGTDRLDPARRFKRVLERVSRCDRLSRATLLVDDFFDFTANERNLLVAVAAAVQSAEITLLIDPASPVVLDPHRYPDELSPLHRTERAYRSLFWALTGAGVRIEPPLKLLQPHRTKRADLLHLERNDSAVFPTEPQHVEWIETPDARAEVDSVARRIDDLLAAGDLRRRDIAVLVRQMGPYQERIESSFREHGRLLYFIDRRRAAVHHPLLRFCRSALLLADGKWSHTAVMSLLKTGLAGVSDEQVDALENYALRHRIRGRRWASAEPWNYRGDDSAVDPATDIDVARRDVAERLRPMIELFRPPSPGTPREGRGEGDFERNGSTGVQNRPHPNPLPGYRERGPETSPTVHDILVELFALLERFEVRKTLTTWIGAAGLEQATEHRAVWAELTELLQHFDELLGETTIGLDDFLAVLDAGLERFDLGLTPPTVDQIIVGEIGRTRLPEVKVVFVLGLNEGLFPQLGSESAVLSDSERRVLRERQIDVSPETDRRLLDEQLLAYVAFTRPSQRLILSRYVADSGAKAQPTHPSTFWNQTRAMFPQGLLRSLARSAEPRAADIATPRQLVTALMHWAQNGEDTGPWPALYDWFRNRTGDEVALLRQSAWPALSYRNVAALPADLASQLFPSPLHATARELETQAECPYRHFVRHGLSLRQREAPDVTGLDLHNGYHRALEQFAAGLLRDGRDWAELPADEIDDRLAPLVRAVGESLRGQILLGTARSRYLLHRIGQMLRLTILAQQAMLNRGRYRPKVAGVEFGSDNGFPTLELSAGVGSLQLHGSIDRIDLHQNGRSFSLIDYSLKSKSLPLADVLNGLALQLLSAVLAVQENSRMLADKSVAAAGAFYLPLLRSPRTVAHPDESKAPDDPDFHLQLKPRGIIDQRALAAFDSQTTQGMSPVVSFGLKADGTPGWLGTTDVATEDQMAALLDRAKQKLGELAAEVMGGTIGVEPYRVGRRTPCPHCEYRAVCRFEPGINHYRFLPGGRRDEVLASLTVGGEPHVE